MSTTAAVAQPDFLASLVNNIPLIIAALGFLGGIVALLFVKPPTYKELADEARSLRSERSTTDDKIAELREDLEAYRQERANERERDRRTIGLMSDGLDAMWAYISVLIDDMTRYGSPVPQPSDYVTATMERARAARQGGDLAPKPTVLPTAEA